jgi:hypothetical protein
MSTPINDGGPAFPTLTSGKWAGTGPGAVFAPDMTDGMSLRAYLAARCPITMEQSAAIYGMPLVSIWRDSEHATSFCHVDASMRLEWVDAMIAKLSEPPST